MLHLDCEIYIAVKKIVRKGEIACNKQFLLFSQCFLPYRALIFHFNLLPDMPISGSSNSAANKDMMSKIWTNGDTII